MTFSSKETKALPTMQPGGGELIDYPGSSRAASHEFVASSKTVWPGLGLSKPSALGYYGTRGCRRDFAPRGIWQCLEIFLVVPAKGGGCYWQLVGRGRDAAKHPTVNAKDKPATEYYLEPRVRSAKVEKLCSREMALSLHSLLSTLVLKEFGAVLPAHSFLDQENQHEQFLPMSSDCSAHQRQVQAYSAMLSQASAESRACSLIF